MNIFSPLLTALHTKSSISVGGKCLVFRWYRGCVALAALLVLAMSVGCGDLGPKPKDFCANMTDCAPGQDCLNAVCVPRRAEGTLPWDEVPTHGDAGQPDSQGECATGTTRDCTNTTGACDGSQQQCVNGTWSECSILPSKEICNNKDDDCDGAVDNNIADLGSECRVEGKEGECAKGKTACEDGNAICQSTYKPIEEVCNGKDDDCNGKIDDIKPAFCEVPGKVGVCQSGVTACQQGLPICEQVNQPSPEICDGKDNNCDGRDDEGCECPPGDVQDCYSGQTGCEPGDSGKYTCKGLCKSGTRTCGRDGKWGACIGEVTQAKEICDGKDNDCDGEIDEDFPRKGKACSDGVGKCEKTGEFVCNKNQDALICNAAAGTPEKEECNGKDDDCNGLIDDNLKRKCQNTQGVCASGTQQCHNGAWLACSVQPTTEICGNGKDDDCNGKTDETSPEICDGVDNDCDNKIDEDCGALHAVASVTAAGVMSAKREFLSAAALAPGKPEYLLTGDANTSCANTVMLLTPLSGNASAATYQCDRTNKNVFRVYTFEEPTLQKKQLAPKPLPFHAVVPKTGAYGTVDCSATVITPGGAYCKLAYANSTVLKLLYANDPNAGLVKIYHDACKDTGQPLFATLIGNSPGYIRAKSVGGGYCEFQTFRPDGKPGFRPFSFWIPPIDEAAWAEIGSDGKVVNQTGTYNRTISARMTNARTLVGGVAYLKDNASYPLWTTFSPVLLMPRADRFASTDSGYAMSIELTNVSQGAQFSIHGYRATGTLVGHTRDAPNKGYFVRIVRLK